MSTRTLHRRLEEHGRSFRDVISEVRRARAEAYLRSPAISLAEVAFLLGYSEQSTFQHAFKRWAGVTPGEFRARHLSRPCAMSYDLVIRGGVVVDGTGLARRRADVAVARGRIAAVGHVPGAARAAARDRRRRADRRAGHHRSAHALRPADHVRSVRDLVVPSRRHDRARGQLRVLDRARARAGPRLPARAVRGGGGHGAGRARRRRVRVRDVRRSTSLRARDGSASTSPATSATRRCAAR